MFHGVISKFLLPVAATFDKICEYFRTFLSSEHEAVLSNDHEILLSNELLF